MIQLGLAPSYLVGRSQTGPVVVDPTGLTIVDYPLDQALVPGVADNVSFYWTAEGVTSGDNLDLQVILLDRSNNRYIMGETSTGLPPGLIVSKLRVFGSPFALRVTALSVGFTGKNLQIWVAITLPPPTR